MRIETDHYEFDLPEDAVGFVLEALDQNSHDVRERLADTILALDDDDDSIRLSIGYADTLLNALAEWERAREGGD